VSAPLPLDLESCHPWPLPRPAGRWRRCWSLVLDLALLNAVGLLLGAALWVAFAEARQEALTLASILRHPGHILAAACLWAVAASLVWWAYFVLLRAACGRTCGEAVWGLRLEAMNGGAPGLGACAVRGLGAIVSVAFLGAGFWCSVLDPQGRTWHDRMSRTRMAEAWPRRTPT
jgi:uncharacterized RDD family membrane protein YckC